MIENKKDNVNANIIDILSTSNILTLHNINNKKQLFTKIADACEKNINTSKSKFLSALLDKEVNQNSGIGEGVAIPNIQTDTIKNMFGVFIKLNKPINFNLTKAPNSQDLPDTFKLNFAINILLTDQMFKTKTLIGKKPYFFRDDGFCLSIWSCTSKP